MNHAKYISRNAKTADQTAGSRTLHHVGRVCKLDETPKRCTTNSKRQTQVPAPCDVANTFLKVRFLPRLAESETIQSCDKSKMEKDFYKSLSIVEEKYKITMQDCKEIPFPYNISASLSLLRKKLKESTNDWQELRLVYDNERTYFAQEDRYNTGMALYYIPVIPLYTLLNNQETSQAGKLLLSVFAYLYQVLKIDYYTNENCYICSNYESIQDWMESDGETEILEELKNAKEIGNLMKPIISDPENLKSYETRLNTYVPSNDFAQNCLQIARRFFNLFSDYPNTAVDRKFYPLSSREELEDDSHNVTLDKYLSFCANVNGNLHEVLFTMVNEDLQEYSEIDEPTRFLPLDGRQIPDNNFDFEHEVFESIKELIAFLDF